MALNIPPPPNPNNDINDFSWKDWFRILRDSLVSAGAYAWSLINFSGSNIKDIETRNHNDLQNVQGGASGQKYHLTASSFEPCSRMSWNVDMGTVNINMGYSNAVNQVGQEIYYPPVLNSTGSTITNGTLVCFNGISSGTPTVTKFLADGSIPPEYVMGIVTANINNGDKGFATQFGYINTVDTSGSSVGETWVAGDILYASPTTAGALTKVKPTVPNIALAVAAVIVADATNGRLLVRVLPQPRLFYGTFYDTTTQNMVAVNTPQAITFNTTGNHSGIDVGSPTSRIVCSHSGQYNFDFSAQIRSSTSSSVFMAIWPRVNGTDVVDSATDITIKSNSDIIVPSWNFQLSMNAGDYFELVWAADNTSVRLDALPSQTSPYVRPAIPSIILNVNQVNQ
jgi:hypothetical protein